MRTLPLYPDLPRAAVQRVPALAHDSACTRCDLAGPMVATPCMKPEGKPGGLLVVADYPGRQEDTNGRPFTGAVGKYLRDFLAKHWQGPIAYDHALRCAPQVQAQKDKLKPKHADACRPYLRTVVEEVAPQRVLAVGTWAAYALLGRKVPLTQVRRGVGWWHNDLDGESRADTAWVPVFMFPNAAPALRNGHVRNALERDLHWALKGTPPPHDFADRVLFYVETVADAQEAERALTGADWNVLDIEGSGVMFEADYRVESVTMYAKGRPEAGWTFDREAIEDAATRAVLVRILRTNRWVGHNLKYDAQGFWSDALFRFWLDLHADTRIWSKLLHGGESSGKLAVCAEQRGMGGHKDEAEGELEPARKDLQRLAQEPFLKPLKPTKKNPTGARAPYVPEHILHLEGPNAQVPTRTLDNLRLGRTSVDGYAYRYMGRDVRARYNARDALATLALAEDYERRIYSAPHLVNVWENVQRDALKATARMEAAGIAFDLDANRLFVAYVQNEQAQVDARLAPYFPDAKTPEALSTALNSPPQLSKLLFETLKLPRVKITDAGNASTDGDVLDALAGKHPIVGDIVLHRSYAYMDSHYGTGMRAWVREDGRIHTEYLIAGAGTGRVSSQQPNLQNLPSPEVEPVILGRMARDQFVAREGYVLRSRDLSQIELRVAAMLSQDPLMIQFFTSGQDFHMATARLTAPQLLKISEAAFDHLPDDQKKVARRRVKPVNFGVLYGKKAHTLAKEMGITEAQAQAILDAILGKFTRLADWMSSTIRSAQQAGGVYVRWNGQKANWRPLPAIGEQGSDGRAKGQRQNAENAAINCLDAETEALTLRGWVKGFDLRKNDLILTRNPRTGALEWERMTDLKLFPDYEGELYEFKSKSFHAVTTPDHRWWCWNKRTKHGVERTSATLSKHGDDRIYRTGEWPETAAAPFEDDEVELAGWFLTDGYFRRTRRVERKGRRGPKPRAGHKVGLCQSARANAAKVLRIDALLVRMGMPFTRRTIARTEMVYWEFWSEFLPKQFPQRKLLHSFVTLLTRAQAVLLMNTMIDGDGCRSGRRETFCTATKSVALAFQYLAVAAGVATTMRWRDMRKYNPTSVKLVNSPKSYGIWQVSILRRARVQVTAAQTRRYTAKVPVWCPVVPNTFFVARRSGAVFITGNTPIQGEASFYTTGSLWPITDAFDAEGLDARIVLTVHDETVSEVLEAHADEADTIMDRILCGHYSAGVPLVSDGKQGRAYGSLQKV